MTQQSIVERIKSYLPTFISTDGVLGSILTVIASAIYDVAIAGDTLLDVEWSGGGLLRSTDDWKLFPSGKESDSQLQDILSDRIAIHQQRGTQKGIIADVKRITADAVATVEVLHADDAGWWSERTFLQIDHGVFSEAVNIVILSYNNAGRFPDSDVTNIIQREFVPLNHAIVYL